MYKILSNVDMPKDIYSLDIKQLNELSQDIRTYLINSISITGGHLASNLGVVELTLALHYSFNLEKDKLIWDVGHQCYTHKILTGRKDKMDTIRQIDGLSGFPKREESKYDIFDTGHSSTSISAAVGIARARDIKHENYNVISVIGDGALTGGMAFEALNDIGKRKSKVIIILNDNEMSISENVGGLALHLSRARVKTRYLNTKKGMEKFVDNIPVVGHSIRRGLHKFKEGLKKLIIPSMLFEELGITYLGPINGHDIEEMIEVFNNAKNINGPVLIHLCTKKGKGYKFAEERPNKYHGVSPFDIETGLSNNNTTKLKYSNVFGNKLCDMAEKNENIVAISAAMIDGTGLDKFSKKYKNRIFDVGIAEQHAVTMAAGLAINGLIPIVALYSSFLQRAYDQLVHDVATQNLHVVFAVDRAGIVGNDGETHQGVFDEGFLTQIPNMTVLAPCCYGELELMMEYAVNNYNGPIAIRYPRGFSDEIIKNSNKPISLGKGLIINSGNDLSIISCGKMVETSVKVANLLKEDNNINCDVVNLRFLKPLDKAIIIDTCKKTNKVVIIDETSEGASFANCIKTIIYENNKECDVYVKTFPDIFIRHGNVKDLFKKHKMDEISIKNNIVERFNLL